MRKMILALLLVGGMTASHADSEADGAAAEKAGRYREAMNRYVQALQGAAEGGDSDRQLRERILGLARKIKPPMALPDEALRHEGRAEAAIQDAKTAQDYQNAAKEYEAALRLAPWNANYYFNLGVVLDKAGKHAEAIRHFKLYLLGAPDSPDRTDVAKRIAGLEYKMEQQSSLAAHAAREKTEFAALARSLEGAVFQGLRVDNDTWTEARVKNGEIVYGLATTDRDMVRFNPQHRDGPSSVFLPSADARAPLSGYQFHPFTSTWCNTGEWRPATGILSRDGSTLTIKYPCIDKQGDRELVLKRRR